MISHLSTEPNVIAFVLLLRRSVYAHSNVLSLKEDSRRLIILNHWEKVTCHRSSFVIAGLNVCLMSFSNSGKRADLEKIAGAERHETKPIRLNVGSPPTAALSSPSMPAGTGDRTSALPAENATGNYVKVVQLLPVRIRFRPNQDELDTLRPGMSVEPKVYFE
jgi:hypothetical protein